MPQGRNPADGIASALRTLRHRYGRWLALELFTRTALVAGAVGYGAFALTPVAGNELRLAVLGTAFLGFLLVLYLLKDRLAPFVSNDSFARFLQSQVAGSRQDYETALSLENEDYADSTTRHLAELHRERALHRLEAMPARTWRVPFTPRPATAAGVLWLAALFFTLLHPEPVREAAATWFRWDRSAQGALAALTDGEKIFAEFTFEVTPPPYTALPVESHTGPGETLEAYLGSSVELSLELRSEAEGARLVLPGGGVVKLDGEGDGYSGAFAVTQGGRFVLEVLRDGAWIADATERTIEVIPDQAPYVALLNGEDERELNPNDFFELAYETTDDFGFTEANLVVEAPGGEQRFPLGVSAEALQYRASAPVDVGTWDVAEGATLQYYVEVYDNDTVSGPKRGTSERLRATITSPRTKHRKLLERMDRLADQVIHVLADIIELPEGFSRIPVWKSLTSAAERIDQAEVEFGALGAELKEDPLADDALTAEFAGLGRRLGRFGAEVEQYAGRVTAGQGQGEYGVFQEGGITETEEISLALLELIREGRMAEMLATSQAIERAREQLKELMEEYRENPTDELREAMKRKVAQIKQLMKELARQQMAMAETLPEEFYNTDAFEKSREADPSGKLSDLENALDEGNPDQLLSQMEDFEKSLDSMLANLEQAGRQAAGSTRDDSYRRLAQALEEVRELERGQKKLAEEIRKTQQQKMEAAAEDAEKLAEEVRRQLQQLREDVDRLRRDSQNTSLWNRGFRNLTPRASQELRNAENAVEAGDWDTARRSTQSAESFLQSMKNQADFDAKAGIGGDRSKDLQGQTSQAVSKARELREKLENPGGQAQQAGQAGERLDELRDAQEKMENRLSDLRRRLDMKDGSTPMPEESRQALEGGQKAMQGARQKMQGNQAAGAAEKAEEASEKLAEARQSMENMQQQMQQQMAGPGGTQGEGDQRDGRMQPEEKVEIPRTAAEKPDRRQELLKGMREGLPEAYEELNRRYYDKLVR